MSKILFQVFNNESSARQWLYGRRGTARDLYILYQGLASSTPEQYKTEDLLTVSHLLTVHYIVVYKNMKHERMTINDMISKVRQFIHFK